MRRILFVLCIAAAAIGVGAGIPADAVTTSCAKPMHVAGPVGLGTVGVDVPSPTTTTSTTISSVGADAGVCISPWLGNTYEVRPGTLSFIYGTDGQGGAWVQACERFGAWYECTSAGVLWNGGVYPDDIAFISLTPSVCDSSSERSYEHCYMVFADAGADGPLGPTTRAGAGVCAAEVFEFWDGKCLVGVGHWEDLRDERKKIQDLLRPITVSIASAR